MIKKNNKGNVIIITLCLIISLMIALVYLLKSTTNRSFTVKKIENTVYARELANTLATLSAHYLKEQIRNQDQEIIDIISLPIDSMANDSGEINLLNKIDCFTIPNNENKFIDLLKEKSGLNQLTIDKLYWKILKSDFDYISIGNSKPYTREKNGLLHIFVELSYLPPGRKIDDKVEESYHFITDLKVVANLLPVVSKFTLYIDDALDGVTDDVERFNVVDSDPNGNLNTENYKPWILNNHDKLEAVDLNLNTYNDIINSKKGLVFLGGGGSQASKAIKLGIAFGETDSRSKYGEGFHFFCTDESGYWKTQSNWTPEIGILTANLGLCREIEPNYNYASYEEGSDDSYSNYFEMTDGQEKDKYNSIFKLYGTDQYPSPTLVLGHVDAKYCSVKQFRFGPDEESYDLLPYVESEDFNYASSYDFNSYEEAFVAHEDDEEDDFDDDLTEFAFKYRDFYSKKLEYSTYFDNYSSRIESIPYNNDYAYVLNHFEVEPFKKQIVKGNKFKKLCRVRNSSIFTKIPSTDYAQFDKILSVDELGDLSKFLNIDKLHINGIEENNNNQRISYYLKLTADEPQYKRTNCFHSDDIETDFMYYLETNGIVIDDKIDFNGWLFINNESNNDFVLNLNNKKLISNGGIILSNGNIRIKSDIKSFSDSNKKYLTILTLENNADIIIERNVEQINASLVSKGGQVRLEGLGSDKYLELNGNMVMKKINTGEEGLLSMRRGVKINYNNNFSAFPFKNTEEEKMALMYNLKINPKLYKYE